MPGVVIPVDPDNMHGISDFGKRCEPSAAIVHGSVITLFLALRQSNIGQSAVMVLCTTAGLWEGMRVGCLIGRPFDLFRRRSCRNQPEVPTFVRALGELYLNTTVKGNPRAMLIDLTFAIPKPNCDLCSVAPKR